MSERLYSIDLGQFDALRKSIQKIDKSLGKELGSINQQAALPLVADIREAGAALGGVFAKAAKSVKAARRANAIRISGGGPKFRFFWGAEFGSKKWRQFPKWRGNQWQPAAGGVGYFMHPTIREHVTSGSLEERFLEGVARLGPMIEAFGLPE